ncbi:hypothetical protein D1BOALGB6SA_15 [Olavius sp. associated proteobacterium Delta 1]|nr:hypothetical protein D1BOALGB6SA_15 [Olavius sp. associated proteobacterium Delta 1]
MEFSADGYLIVSLWIVGLIATSAVLTILAILFRALYRRKIFLWLLGYIYWAIDQRRNGTLWVNDPIHVLFCFVDHFEPGWNQADLKKERERVDGWMQRYPSMAIKFSDGDGVHPKHTWFYPPHYFKDEHIKKLLYICKQGFGEIEMHLHHSRMEPFPDTSESLRQKILDCIQLYSRYGIFETKIEGGRVLKYAFIHGDWALDGSRPEYCSVNDELKILSETGCYADFTFPSYMIESQPRMINTIYYANDEPDKPKSYDRGVPVCVGGKPSGDLLIIQGPLGFRWEGRQQRWFPSVDDGEISSNNPPTKDRIDFWVNTGIHIKGKSNWKIVKVFTHGAACREHATLLGKPIEQMHAYLNEKYNDGEKYSLHYLTARELYNIIKAAEMNMSGDPGEYRNLIISGYNYCKGFK